MTWSEALVIFIGSFVFTWVLYRIDHRRKK